MKPKTAVYALVAAASLATAAYQPTDSLLIEARDLVAQTPAQTSSWTTAVAGSVGAGYHAPAALRPLRGVAVESSFR